MRNTIGSSRVWLLLALALPLIGMPACVQVHAKGKRFDIPAQPAAGALNEFARQADATLIFSYDLVAGQRAGPLKGSFTVGEGLTRLLDGTRLGYRQAVDGTYLICPLASCGMVNPDASESPDPAGRERQGAPG